MAVTVRADGLWDWAQHVTGDRDRRGEGRGEKGREGETKNAWKISQKKQANDGKPTMNFSI